MTWYKFSLSHLNDAIQSQLNAIPGLVIRGREVQAHDNAAFLVEQICARQGVRAIAQPYRLDGEPLQSLDVLVENGLRDWVPAYLTPYQRDGILATAHRDAHLWWAAGCLTGDTVVWVKRHGQVQKMELRELVHKFNNVWKPGIKTCVLAVDEETKESLWQPLKAAVVSGVKPVFRVSYGSLSTRATADHQFLTELGWKKLSELRAWKDRLIAPAGFTYRHAFSTPNISNIEPCGEEETFDLCMEAPHHNFVANGIVVHNSGKTVGAICWALAVPGPVVMVTRAGVRRSHGREIERVTHHRAFVIESKDDAKALDDSEALFAVVGWEMLPDVVDQLILWRPTSLILDEAHRAKSNKRWGATVQSDGKLKFDPLENIAQSVYKLSRAVKRRLATTATPIKDRTRDLWAQLDLVHPDAWGRFYAKDRASFTGRYCAAREGFYGGIDTSGSSNLDELWSRVSLVTNHVPHSVTHRHLPPRRRIVTYVTPAEQVRAEGFTKTYFKQAAKGGKTGMLEARLMEAAAKKRKVLIELVEEAVSCKQKVVIFTGRREDCERLGEDVKKVVPADTTVFVGHGGTPAAERDFIQQKYMIHSGPCVLVGTGDAWGEGVSLHDTDLALIAMLPYTPGAIVQWEGRFSRQGQKRPVLIQYLVAEGTVDEHVVGILLDKLRPVEKVSHDDSIDGFADSLQGTEDDDAIIQSVLAKLEAQP